MNAASLRRLRAALDDALSRPVAERAACVAALAAEDAGLGRELQALLADADREDPRFEPLLPSLQDHGADDLAAGRCLGPWRLVAPLGRGGMGDVWLAERADGAYTQRVAIKAPRAAGSGAAAFARFERERSLLAEFEHPGIVRLVDGGWTGPGRPWLAMEYVAGDPIDVHAEARRLDARARVALLLQAAQVLAAAHRRRIVHRDLKPSNVLVRQDGRVVLVDFGIAAALGESRDDGGSWLATPRYAAPEQLRGEPASTASDVYSLARVGRELVAAADPDLAAVFAAAQHEDPERRPASAAAFARELERWLQRLPVEARPASPWHRARLFLRRDPLAAGAVAAALLAVCAGLVVVTISWRAEAAARRQAADARDALGRRYVQVRELVADLVTGVHDRVGTLPGAVPVRAFLVQRAEAHLERLAVDAADDPELAREVIEVGLRLADVRGARTQGHGGDLDGALRSARAAAEAAGRWATRQPDAVEWPALEARGRRQTGDLLRARGEPGAAAAEYRAALAAVARARERADDATVHARLAAILELQLGRLDVATGDLAAGLARLATAEAALEAIRQQQPRSRDAVRDAILARSERAYALAQSGQDAAAASVWEQALELLAELEPGHPGDVQLARDRIEMLTELALCRAVQGQGRAATEAWATALAQARTLVEQDRDNLLSQRQLERTLLRGARIASATGAADLAAQRYREAEPMLRASWQASGGSDRDVTLDLAESLVGRAEADRRLGRTDGVETAFEEALVLLAVGDPLARGEHLAGNLMTMAWVGLGNLPLAAGDAATARARFAACREPTQAWAERFPDLPWPLPHLGALEYGLATAAEAQAADPTLAMAEQIACLDEALAAFTRGLEVARRLHAEGRLAGIQAGMPEWFAADVARVRTARERLAQGIRPTDGGR